MSHGVHPARALHGHLRRAGALLNERDFAGAADAVSQALAIDPASVAAGAMRDRIERERVQATDPRESTQTSDTSTAVPARATSSSAPVDRFIPFGVDAQSWLGFEQRVQERRFRALVETARGAIETGDKEAAMLALGEARELRPQSTDLEQLAERVERLPMPVPTRGFSPHLQYRAASAVITLLVGVSLLVGIDWMRAEDTTPNPVAGGPVVASDVRAPVSATLETSFTTPTESKPSGLVQPVPVSVPLSVPVASTGFDEESSPIAIDSPRPRELAAPARQLAVPAPTTRPSLRPSPLSEPVRRTGETPDDYVAPQTRRASEMPTTPIVAAPRMPEPASSLTAPASLSAAGSPVASVARQPVPITGLGAAPAAAASVVASTRADETRVAQVLNQYARAYGELDATAARAVWPSVDERALARAFAGLASQNVSFDSCDIDVRGVTANASCRGRASFVGKIGSREERSEPRQWRFELRRDGEAWKIETAEARRVAY